MKVETNRTLQYKFLQWHPIYTCTRLYLIVYGLGEQLAPSTAWWGMGEVIPVTLFVHRVFCRKSPMKYSAYCYCFYPLLTSWTKVFLSGAVAGAGGWCSWKTLLRAPFSGLTCLVRTVLSIYKVSFCAICADLCDISYDAKTDRALL